MKSHYRKYCRILTQVVKEAKCMPYSTHILGSDKVKAVWKIVKKERRKVCTKVTTSIKINDNVIQNPKLVALSFST
jgi:hypothetical protein